MSRQHTSFKLAPGVSPAVVEPQVQRLVRLDLVLPQVVERALADVQERFASAPSPIGWMYVGTPEGVHASYPGHGGYDPAFDPRKRPWYQLSEGRDPHLVHWGNPYRDASGLGLILPCSKALVDANGRALGVAGMDITFDYLIEALLTPDTVEVDEAMLLDGQGQIVVRSRGAQEEEAGTLKLAPHPDPAVRKAAIEARAETLRRGRSTTLIFPLHALGWAYVVETTEEALLK